MRVPEDADRDFVAGCYIIKDEEILLIKHSKLGIWLPPGGHVENDETPDETAERETLEETGWKISLNSNTKNYDDRFDAEDIPTPFNINLHRIKEGHWHCDFQYLGEPLEKTDASHQHEHDGQEWFKKGEISELETAENVKSSIRKAFRIKRLDNDGRNSNQYLQ